MLKKEEIFKLILNGWIKTWTKTKKLILRGWEKIKKLIFIGRAKIKEFIFSKWTKTKIITATVSVLSLGTTVAAGIAQISSHRHATKIQVQDDSVSSDLKKEKGATNKGNKAKASSQASTTGTDATSDSAESNKTADSQGKTTKDTDKKTESSEKKANANNGKVAQGQARQVPQPNNAQGNDNNNQGQAGQEQTGQSGQAELGQGQSQDRARQNQAGRQDGSNQAQVNHGSVIGLVNIGNSCYMNAALQALNNYPEVRNAVMAHAPVGKPRFDLFRQFCFEYQNGSVSIGVLQNLLNAYGLGPNADANEMCLLIREALRDVIPSLGSAIADDGWGNAQIKDAQLINTGGHWIARINRDGRRYEVDDTVVRVI